MASYWARYLAGRSAEMGGSAGLKWRVRAWKERNSQEYCELLEKYKRSSTV